MTDSEAITAAYKRGLLLDDGDLVLADGRLTEISGVANLQQGLTLRILTPLGTDPLNASYGLDVSDAFTGSLTRQLAKEARRRRVRSGREPLAPDCSTPGPGSTRSVCWST
jgi:hypothetical protein